MKTLGRGLALSEHPFLLFPEPITAVKLAHVFVFKRLAS